MFLFVSAWSVFAAEIKRVDGTANTPTKITITGPINWGDDEKFDRIALQLPRADVVLSSPGGDSRAGMEIAKTVTLRGYKTIVPPNTLCASMCALIWISGEERVASPTSLIGFHSAYRVSDGAESGEANGSIAIHLFQLDLQPSAIAWMQREGPNGMAWLTPKIADEFGIAVSYENTAITLQDLSKSANTEPNYGPATVEENEPLPLPPAPNNFEESKFAFLVNRDIFGYDLGEAKLISSETSCAKSCENTANCKAYTYNKPNSLCYLKSGGKEVMWNKNAVSEHVSTLSRELKFLKITIVNSTKLEGKTYASKTGSDLVKCASSCDSDKQCSGFEFERQPVGACRLKTGNLKRVKKARLTAGVKTAE